MNLDGRTVLITGASSGLGRGLALALAERGCNLVLTARREKLLAEVAAEVEARGGRSVVVPADATVAAQSQAVVDAGIAAFGPIDVAVLNAGGGTATDMAEASVDDVLWIMRANFDTLVTFLCPLIQQMKGHRSVIAYTGSPSGFFGLPKSGPYSAAKAAGRVLLDSCRIELADTEIGFVSLYPGFTYTDAMDPADVPFEWLIIQRERSVAEMLRAIEKEWSHHVFPRRIRWPIALGRALPEPVRRFVLRQFA